MKSPRLGAVVLLGLTASGCGDRARSDDFGTSTLTVHVPSADEWLFGPAQADEPMALVFLPIAHVGKNGEIEGRLVRSWERSEDYRHWTVHLRTDVRWHDGVPVTAQDVAFTADLLMHPDVARVPSGAFAVTVVNDSTYTVEINTQDERGVAAPTRAPNLTNIPLPKHLLEHLNPGEFFEWDFWLEPVGNGPYRYVRHVPHTMVELEANPDFYLGEPAIERVVLKFSGQNQLTELLADNVDVALYIKWLDLLTLADDERFRSYWSKDTWVFMGILWNVRSGPLADPLVRRALTMAIDRQGLYRALNLPADVPPIEAVFTERQYWRGDLTAPVPYDPAAAQDLLAEAGWTTGGDGGLERDGERLAFTTIVYVEDAIVETAAVYVQDQLRDLGVEMRLDPMDPGVLRQRATDGDFDAILGEVLTAPTWLDRQFGSQSFLGYQNVRVAELIARARTSLDPNETDNIYSELRTILRTDLPMTALFPDYEMHVVNRRVRGLSSPWRSVPLRHMEELSFEEPDR